MSIGHLIFREVKNMDDLLPILKLRYTTFFNEGALTQNFLYPNSLNLDIDSFDLNARHFGLYQKLDETETLIGSCRLIYESDIEFDLKEPILDFAKTNKDIYKRIIVGSIHPMYFLEVDHGVGITKFYNQCKQNNFLFCEASRICVPKEFRNLKTLMFLIRCLMAAYHKDGLTNIGIVCTTVKKSKLYERFLNMVPIAESEFFINQEKCIVLKVNQENFTPKNLELFELLGEQLNKEGEIIEERR